MPKTEHFIDSRLDNIDGDTDRESFKTESYIGDYNTEIPYKPKDIPNQVPHNSRQTPHIYHSQVSNPSYNQANQIYHSENNDMHIHPGVHF
ncbi:hypothetical protein, partial [Salmonella sp. s51228]|uniref:hypothetical protein n=1 Tax=Salmonella sp. s51228 TaxID=3159652 RepID=UPI0039812ECC